MFFSAIKNNPFHICSKCFVQRWVMVIDRRRYVWLHVGRRLYIYAETIRPQRKPFPHNSLQNVIISESSSLNDHQFRPIQSLIFGYDLEEGYAMHWEFMHFWRRWYSSFASFARWDRSLIYCQRLCSLKMNSFFFIICIPRHCVPGW